VTVPQQNPAGQQECDEVAAKHDENAVVERHQPPEMLLVLEELRRETRVGERPRPVAADGHQKEGENRHVRQGVEQ